MSALQSSGETPLPGAPHAVPEAKDPPHTYPSLPFLTPEVATIASNTLTSISEVCVLVIRNTFNYILFFLKNPFSELNPGLKQCSLLQGSPVHTECLQVPKGSLLPFRAPGLVLNLKICSHSWAPDRL